MKRPPRVARLFVLACFLGCLVGCAGPGHIQFDGGKCLRDGQSLTIAQVEDGQTGVARRIASRQPWFVVITIGIVLLAAMGNVEKVVVLVRARRHEGDRPFAEALREALARQREKPALFATIVGGSMALIAIGAVAYVYLDVDKRASERALGMLQFCHLALRTQQEEGALDEQRHNLESIQSTAGDIRELLGKLPPDEKRKAQLIVDQMNSALDRQGKIVGEYAVRTNEAQKEMSTHTVAMEKGLASVEGELAELKSLPANLKDLEGAAHRIDENTSSVDSRFADLRTHMAAIDGKLDTLLTRPTCAGPAAREPKEPPKEVKDAKEPTAPIASAPPPVAVDAGKSGP